MALPAGQAKSKKPSKTTSQEPLVAWRQEIDVALIEIQLLAIGYDIFHEVGRMIAGNPSLKSNPFAWYLGRAYLDWAVTSARRLLDIRGDAHSFRRLLDQVDRYPAALSREMYVAASKRELPLQRAALIVRPRGRLTKQEIEKEANSRFDELVGQGQIHITPEQVRADKESLVSAAEVLKRYADNVVAHRNKGAALKRGDMAAPRPAANSNEVVFPQETDLKRLVDTAKSLLEKYHSLLHGRPPLWGAPPADWKDVFTRPWCAVKE